MKNIIVVEPIGGLGNMLRVVFSYHKVAQRDNKTLIVIWKKSDACNGFFLDYFQPVEGITFLEKNLDKLKIDYYGCISHSDFNVFSNFIYSDLKVNQDIYNSIDERIKILKTFIAIQVRRTDHTAMAMSVNSFTSDEEFCKFIESNPSGNLFITADNKESYDYFKNKYPDRVKINYPDSDSTKLRHTSLKDSIIDLFVCSQARKIMTSGYSSFGDLINQLHDNFIFSTR